MKGIYRCMECGMVYNENNKLPLRNVADGCCSVGSLIEFEPLTQTRIVILDFGKTNNEPNIQIVDGKN